MFGHFTTLYMKGLNIFQTSFTGQKQSYLSWNILIKNFELGIMPRLGDLLFDDLLGQPLL